MSCADEKHDWRTVAGDLLHGPSTREDRTAWCRACGALWTRLLTGWGITYPLADHGAPRVLGLSPVVPGPPKQGEP